MKKFLKNIIWRFRNLGYQKTDFGTKLKLKSYMDHLVFKEVFIEKIYDDFIKYSLIQSVDNHEAKRIFDIGGNLGFFTIRCCEIWKQFRVRECVHFVIYEPSENCIGRLKENLKGFDSNIFSFDIRNKLVGKKDGWDWFIEDKDHHLGQCVSEKIKKKGKRYSRKIAYHNLSRDLEFSNIDLLKCDIEGSEVEFLKNYSASLQTTENVIIEAHGKSAESFVCKKLHELGFSRCLNTKNDEDSNFSNLFFKKNRN